MNEALEEVKEEILEEVKDVEPIFVYGSYAFGRMKRARSSLQISNETSQRDNRFFDKE